MATHKLLRVSVLVPLSLLAVAAGLVPTKGKTVTILQPQGGLSPDGSSSRPVLARKARSAAFRSEATNLVPGDADPLADIVVVRMRKDAVHCASVATDGTKANGASDKPALDAYARRVAFTSEADNLVAGDLNGVTDIFVRDVLSGQTERVSVASDGTEANGPSDDPALSCPGTLVVFSSHATNLVPGDTNGASDIFVHDRRRGETRRVSVAADGSQANGHSTRPELSNTGHWMTFVSDATNLVPGDLNGQPDVFVCNLRTGAIELVSLATDGTQANAASARPAISANGRFIAFESAATNLDPADGFAGVDVFVRDRRHGRTGLASGSASGPADGPSTYASLSASGRWIAFASAATNLVAGDTNGCIDVFRKNLRKGSVDRLSVSSDGEQGDDNSIQPSLSGQGRYALFATRACNILPVPGDGQWQVGLRKP